MSFISQCWNQVRKSEAYHYQRSERSAANFVSVTASMVVEIDAVGTCMGGV